MIKRLMIPAAAALVFGAVAATPQPAAANYISGAATATQSNAQIVSDVIEVRRRGRHRSHRRHYGHRHRGYSFGYYAPRAYYAPRCGYTWSWRRHRNIWRCW